MQALNFIRWLNKKSNFKADFNDATHNVLIWTIWESFIIIEKVDVKREVVLLGTNHKSIWNNRFNWCKGWCVYKPATRVVRRICGSCGVSNHSVIPAHKWKISPVYFFYVAKAWGGWNVHKRRDRKVYRVNVKRERGLAKLCTVNIFTFFSRSVMDGPTNRRDGPANI